MERRTGELLALAAAVAFSMKAILVKLAIGAGAHVLPLLTTRMLMAAPLFLLVALRAPRPTWDRRDAAAILVLGLAGYHLAATLDFLGLQHITAGLERIVLYVHPTFVVLLGALLGRRAIAWRELASIGVCWLGLLVAVSGDLQVGQPDAVLTGVLLVLGSAFAYAAYLLGTEHLSTRLGGSRVGALAASVSAASLLLQETAVGALPEVLAPGPEVGRLALGMALFATVLPVLLLAEAIVRIGPARASTIGMVGPISAGVLGWLVLGEPLLPAQLVGGVIVVLGVWWGRRRPAA